MRILARHALPPTLVAIGDRLEKKDVALGLDSERGLEWRDQREADPPQLYGLKNHPLRLSSRATSSEPRLKSAAAAFSSSWPTLDAPGMATTLGLATSHARATWAAVAWCRPAISRSAATSGSWRARAAVPKSALKRRKLPGAVI